MIIAIDGPAGSGKSTVAKLVAARLGFHYLDTGAMYRALAVLAMDDGVSLDDDVALRTLAHANPVTFMHDGGSAVATGVSIAGRDVTHAIREPRTDAAVSTVAKLAGVRDAMVAQQRDLARVDDVVMEGRDIGTVVFPDAEVKIFLTASEEERARRRAAQQGERGHASDAAEVLRALQQRDAADSTRKVAPLVAAADAIQLDTTGLTIDEVVGAIARIVQERR